MDLLANIARKVGQLVGIMADARSESPQIGPAGTSPPAEQELDHLKLVTIIVHEEEADRTLAALINEGYPATKISSSGGFLHKGMATILSGVEASEVDGLVFLVKDVCPSRYQILPHPLRLPLGHDRGKEQPEMRVGGAVIFVQDVERFEKA